LRGKLDGPLRRLKVPAHVIVAFTGEDVQKLLATAAKITGWFRQTGIKRRDWWIAFIHVAWDTCFRAGDLLDLRFSDLRANHCVVKIQRKTGRQYVGKLRDETWNAVQVIKGQGEQAADRCIFPWASRREAFYKAFRELAAEAGVRGTSKYMRRARATDEYKRRGPAAAATVLGHADGTGQLAMRNYIDKSQLSDDIPMPPAIGLERESGSAEYGTA
jgi:integrase